MRLSDGHSPRRDFDLRIRSQSHSFHFVQGQRRP
jgi:hypothetical protein